MKERKWVKWLIFGTGISLFAVFSVLFIVFLFVPGIKDDGTKVRTIALTILFGLSLSYFIFSLLYLGLKKISDKNAMLKQRLDQWSEISYHVAQLGDDVIDELPVGILVTSNEHKCEWQNQALRNIFGRDVEGINLVELIPDLKEFLETKNDKITVSIGQDRYDIIRRRKNNAYFFFNVTQREEVKEKFIERSPVIGIISLDNLEESISGLDVAIQASTRGLYFSAITDWALKYSAFLKTFNNDKMFFVTYRKSLDDMISGDFEVLEKVRKISFENNILVTLSIGIAAWDLPMAEISSYAQNAVELAEKRGGDQVVINIEGEPIKYFGAKVDKGSKGSKVNARVSAENLKKLVSQASNVFVMTHKNADTDAFASMLTVTNMLKADGKSNVYAIVDYEKLDKTVQKIFQIQVEQERFLVNEMMTSKDALSKVSESTLLITVDTQSKNLINSLELLNKVSSMGTVAIIDHHRAADDSFRGKFEYIEPSASSTTELLIELLEFYTPRKEKMTPFLATVLYSGLIVDTNNFSQRTGSRTFEAAAKLKEYGADIGTVRKWLRKDQDRLFLINEVVNNAEFLINGKVAVAHLEDITEDPVLPAQIADDLLQIDGVEASFAIIAVGEKQIAVSARSMGLLNVQIIMEQLGGGGHFTAAAARFKDKTVKEVSKLLKKQIVLEFSEEGERVKVILLEDIKGRGNKNDIIEVQQGYGNFLIKNNQAIMATNEAVAELEKEKAAKLKAEDDKVKMLKRMAEEIEKKTITVPIQVGNEGKMFGSVTTKDVADAFQEQNKIVIDKRKVKLTSEITGVGIYEAVVDLHPGIEAKFKIYIVEK